MNHCFKYAIAQFQTDSLRNERLNLALVILHDDKLEVRLPKSLDKLRAISAALDLDLVREQLGNLPSLDQIIREQGTYAVSDRLRLLADFSAVQFSAPGDIFASNADLYSHHIEQLLTKLVEPERAPPGVLKHRSTRLLSDVKRMFKAERVLARKGEDLNAHRIVPNHKIAEGLAADLLLKNGSMHVVQTVDASSEDGSPRRAIHGIAVSALVFEHSRMTFGEERTQARLVYQATSSLERLISPSLYAAEHQGAFLVNWESRDDRNRFVIELSSLAQPVDNSRDRSATLKVHASIQPKLRLN